MTTKKKLGRPPVESPKAVMLSARFTEDEARDIRQAVKQSGQKPTEWLRNSLISTARQTIRNT